MKQLDTVITNNKITLINAQRDANLVEIEAEMQSQLRVKALDNQGKAVVAEISADGKVDMQHVANNAKIITAEVAKQSKLESEHIKNDGKTGHIALENAIAPKENK